MKSIFSVERLTGYGRYMHCHTHLQIYGVIKGSAAFIISGESRVLTEGQIAIAHKHENHSLATECGSELLSVPVGAGALMTFSYLYANEKLPRWLTDTAFNQKLFAYIANIEEYAAQTKTAQLQLRITGVIYELLADVIEHYGLENVNQVAMNDMELATKVSQYVYEHYSERITLQTLANAFHISPTVLSKKLRKCLGVDLRIFVNDVRVQKAVQLLNDPERRNRSVYDIAMSCGFNSMSTFYRCYKRNFSMETFQGAEEKQQ